MNSEIEYIMHSISRDAPAYAYPPIRDISSWQRDMIHSLEDWVSQIPRPASSDCDWIARLCKIRYHEIMIWLLRPSPAIQTPSDDSLCLCFHQAVELLRAFGKLYRSGNLLYSRLVVHSILLGALVMLHCIWKVPSIATKCRVDELAANLNTSQNILSSTGKYWTEANRARDWVDELSNITLARLWGKDQAATLRYSPTAQRVRPRLDNDQVVSDASEAQRETARENGNDDGQADLNVHPHPDQRHIVDMTVTHDHTNLFDDFLQGKLPRSEWFVEH